ncbi:MAG: bifunctional phosphoribosyl-AMP cyclohydrolase/phosphoribosyl-ATP diphosphatase HisIE [Cyanobacteria bacterium P01_H01_bin.74]
MIVPSIDLMNGQAVQLRQGKDRIITADEDPISLAKRFNRFGELAVIDLDAALSKGDNLPLIKQLCSVADVRVGGGIRSVERAKVLLKAGAKRLIIGTSATPEFLTALTSAGIPKPRIMVALDHKNGMVVDQGWVNNTGEGLLARAKRLKPYCESFLCTFVNTEGTMAGLPLAEFEQFRSEISHPVTVAGGIATTEEAVALVKRGVDVQVGMALYTGQLNLADTVVGSLDFEKCPLIPTIVQDTAGQVLMLAYSTQDSLKMALNEAKGIYFSRSRNTIWVKGATSGHTQALICCRVDCDQDALLFTVKQTGPACHTGAYSCFGSGLKTPEFSLEKLFETLTTRKENPPEGSYTAKLFSDPIMLHKKVIEEAFEVAIAPDNDNRTWEIADSLFFLCVVAAANNIPWSAILSELGGRHSP